MNAASHSGLPTDRKPEFPCSPFFACGANHGMVIPDLLIQIDLPTHSAEKKVPSSFTCPPFMTLSSIWQPPKQA